jgi:hypothetical protein
MGTIPELLLEAETLQKPAEKTTMEEETNKLQITNAKRNSKLARCRKCAYAKKLANGEELGKNTQEEEESVCDGMERDTAGKKNMAIYEMSKQH